VSANFPGLSTIYRQHDIMRVLNALEAVTTVRVDFISEAGHAEQSRTQLQGGR